MQVGDGWCAGLVFEMQVCEHYILWSYSQNRVLFMSTMYSRPCLRSYTQVQVGSCT